MRISCRHPNGRLILNLTNEATIFDLRNKISEELNCTDPTSFLIKYNFPPQAIDFSENSSIKLIKDLPLKDGDAIIVSKQETRNDITPNHSIASTNKSISKTKKPIGQLFRKHVAADNSCLFTSVNYCLTSAGRVSEFNHSAAAMRKLIASLVRNDPVTFNEGILGKRNEDYAIWITNPNHWGGGIEVALLSKRFGIEIDIVDTQTNRIDRFGEDQNFAERILLIYNGIHYDPLAMKVSANQIRTRFPVSDLTILTQAMALANEAKSNRQYTDLQNFTIRCMKCNECLAGQEAAYKHAKETGHTDFGEI